MTLLEQGYIPGTNRAAMLKAIFTISTQIGGRIAGAIGAQSPIVMTDMPILRDKDDPATLISEVTLKQAKQLLQRGLFPAG